jgi:catechol-2,3-dioxygenase
MSLVRTGSAGLNVTDLARSMSFYEQALGFETIRRSSDLGRPWTHLGYGGTVLLTLWQQSTAGFRTDRAGLHHLSFEVADVSALHEVENRLRAVGVPIRDDTGVPGAAAETGQIFFVDPDGIRLEVYADSGPPVDWSTPLCGFYERR